MAGSAIHEITEAIDRAELLGLDWETALEVAPSFQSKFDELLEEERTWSVNSESHRARGRFWKKDKESGELKWIGLGEQPKGGREIKPSGRIAKSITPYGGPNKKDYDWWLLMGPVFIRRYINWRKATGYEIAIMPDGKIGIELGFVIELDGQKIQGFIDRVFYDPATDTYVVVDLKTGKEPSGSLQLMTYFLAMLLAYGLKEQWALFWTPAPPMKPRAGEEPVEPGSERDWGKSSEPVDTDGWSIERLKQLFAMVVRGMRAGVFLPTVTNMCTGCTVKDYCFAVKGKKAHLVPERDVVVERGTGEVVFDGSQCKFDDVSDALPQGADDLKREGVANGSQGSE